MMRILIFVFCLPWLGTGVHGWREWLSGDKILVSDIDHVIGTRGRMANSRPNSAPVPQLECLSGGSAGCGRFQPDVVTCYNRGGSGLNVQWKCYAVMEPGYHFGRIDVNCEGYSYPGDPYVLVNSCAIRYTLNVDSYYYNPLPSRGYFPSTMTLFVIFALLSFVIVIFCFGLIENGPRDRNIYRAYQGPTYYDTYFSRPRTEVVYVSHPSYHHTDTYSAGYTSRGTNTEAGYATTSSRGRSTRNVVSSGDATTSSR